MKKAYQVYCRIEEAVCGVFFFGIVALIFSSAVLRLFKNPLIWADDLAKLLFAWAAFLGADVAMRKCRLVGVDFLLKRFPPVSQKLVLLAGNLIIAVVLAAFVYYGFILAYDERERHFQTIPITYAYVTLCLPIASLSMLITTSLKIFKLLCHLTNDDYSLAKEAQQIEKENLERQVI